MGIIQCSNKYGPLKTKQPYNRSFQDLRSLQWNITLVVAAHISPETYNLYCCIIHQGEKLLRIPSKGHGPYYCTLATKDQEDRSRSPKTGRLFQTNGGLVSSWAFITV